MTEQERLDEVGILDKACRQCATEFAQAGVRGLAAHAINVAALNRKFERLEAAFAEAAAQVTSDGPAEDPIDNVHRIA